MRKEIILLIILTFLLLLILFIPQKQSQAILDGNINLDNCSGDIYITESGTYTITGNSKNITLIVCKGDVIFNFKNANMESSRGPCIIVEEAQSFKLNFVDNSQNSIITTDSKTFREYQAAIYSREDLTIDGNGAVTIQCNIGHGIKGNDSVIINNGNFIIDVVEDGIHANENIIINDGDFSFSTVDKAIRAEKNLDIYNGEFKIQSGGDAVRAEDTLNIHNGVINIVSESEGLESKNEIVIHNGTINIDSKDDGINASNKIIINHGKIRVISSENDAIDSNGAIIINDGIIYASGYKSPEGAIDCDGGLLQVNGGTIMGVGRMNSYYNVGNQNILMINPEKDMYIKNIRIQKMNDIVFEYQLHEYDTEQTVSIGSIPTPVTRPFNNTANLLGCSVSLFISCPKLESGQYSVFLNDVFYANVEIADKYTILGVEPAIKFPK